MDLYITTKGFSYVFRRLKNQDSVRRSAPLHYEVQRVDMALRNAHIGLAQATLSYMEGQANFNNYYEGVISEKERPIGQVYFHAVYPGIDWVLSISKDDAGHSLLKQNFILHPGADSRLIQVTYSPNVKVAADDSGKIFVTGRMAALEEKQLFVYKTASRRRIPVKVRISGHDFPIGSQVL